MKITIAYTAGEEKKAGLIETFVNNLMGSANIRKSDRHAPFKHIYLTTEKPKTPRNAKEIR